MSEPQTTTHEPVVIEHHNSDNVEWLVSFDGHNPAEGLFLSFTKSQDAFLVRNLLWALMRIRDFKNSTYCSDWKQYAEDALKELPI